MENCPHGYLLSCPSCKGKGKATVKELKSEFAELKIAYEQKLIRELNEAKDSEAVTVVDAVVSAIAELSARLHQLEVKVFWIKGK